MQYFFFFQIRKKTAFFPHLEDNWSSSQLAVGMMVGWMVGSLVPWLVKLVLRAKWWHHTQIVHGKREKERKKEREVHVCTCGAQDYSTQVRWLHGHDSTTSILIRTWPFGLDSLSKIAPTQYSRCSFPSKIVNLCNKAAVLWSNLVRPSVHPNLNGWLVHATHSPSPSTARGLETFESMHTLGKYRNTEHEWLST